MPWKGFNARRSVSPVTMCVARPFTASFKKAAICTSNLNPFGLARQSSEKAADVFLIHLSKEFFPVKNFMEFSERRKGEQDSSYAESQIEGMTRF
jgi:hypothetical protein